MRKTCSNLFLVGKRLIHNYKSGTDEVNAFKIYYDQNLVYFIQKLNPKEDKHLARSIKFFNMI